MVDKPCAICQENADHLNIPTPQVITSSHLAFPGYTNGCEAIVLSCCLNIFVIKLRVSFMDSRVYLDHEPPIVTLIFYYYLVVEYKLARHIRSIHLAHISRLTQSEYEKDPLSAAPKEQDKGS